MKPKTEIRQAGFWLALVMLALASMGATLPSRAGEQSADAASRTSVPYDVHSRAPGASFRPGARMFGLIPRIASEFKSEQGLQPGSSNGDTAAILPPVATMDPYRLAGLTCAVILDTASRLQAAFSARAPPSLISI